MNPADLDLAAIRGAQARIRPHLGPSPLRRSFALAQRGAIDLKLECWQPTGSFKVRGALSVLTALAPEEHSSGVVAASAGNHALGVAFAAGALGGHIAATLFVPEGAPRSKRDKLRSFPVTVREVEGTYDDAHDAAHAHAERTGARYVHAFDDPLTAAGQGTVGLEILEQRPDVGTIVVPVGGGGLIASLALAVKALAPDVRIVAVQPEASPALPESLRLGRPLLTYPAGPTLADGLAGGIGEMVFAHRHLIDEVVLVSEQEIAEAIVALLAKDQVVAEGSGAVGVAALLCGRVAAGGERPAGVRGRSHEVAGAPEARATGFTPGASRPTVVVVTGGNIDISVLGGLLVKSS